MKIEELEALCNVATPGPWVYREYVSYEGNGYDYFETPDGDILTTQGCIGPDKEQCKKDKIFISKAREYMPKLLAVVNAAKALTNKMDGMQLYDEFYLTQLESTLEELEK